jgi:hypothetical protein
MKIFTAYWMKSKTGMIRVTDLTLVICLSHASGIAKVTPGAT